MQDPMLSDLAYESARLWIGEATFAHCISFMHDVNFGTYLLDKMQVDVGVCALLSERYGHPAWALMSRVLPLHIGAEASSSIAEQENRHLRIRYISNMDPEIGVAVLATKHHTMGAIHMRGTRCAVDGRAPTNPNLNALAGHADDFFTRCGFPTAEIEIQHPWIQKDDESCGFLFLDFLHHRLFNASDVDYAPPQEDEMKQTWRKMAILLDNICKNRFGMTMQVDEPGV
jgi:hypothetical protein